jgi:hypothetical protein
MYFVPRLQLVVVALLVAACAAQPVALDACGAACERAHIAAAPPCHHEAAAAGQIGHPARPCGQDHAVVPADSGSVTSAQRHLVASMTARMATFRSSPCRASITFGVHSPPLFFIPPESNTPLRV